MLDFADEILRKRYKLYLQLSEKEIVFMNFNEILELHNKVMLLFNQEPRLRDEGLLKSAIDSVLNVYSYKEEKDIKVLAAVLLEKIIKNHPFLDGNKRTAALAFEVFLNRNGMELELSDSDFLDKIYKIAENKLDAYSFFEKKRGQRKKKL